LEFEFIQDAYQMLMIVLQMCKCSVHRRAHPKFPVSD
jgi:hypothetical protein